MKQFRCPSCDGNIRTIGLGKGTKVYCRHCGETSITTEDNFREGEEK